MAFCQWNKRTHIMSADKPSTFELNFSAFCYTYKCGLRHKARPNVCCNIAVGILFSQLFQARPLAVMV